MTYNKWYNLQAQSCLCNLGICVHPTRTRDSFCCGHDDTVKEWMYKLSHATDKHPGFQIVGDNVDVYVNVRHETMAKKAKDMHWFQI